MAGRGNGRRTSRNAQEIGLMATTLYLLDTNILVALIRGQILGQYIDRTYQLRGQSYKVSVDIDQPAVLDAYVEFEWFSLRHPGGARNMGKNDLWIAAATKATGATLLTTDTDFNH